MSPLDDKLAELRQRFVARAPDEVAALDTALAGGDRETLIDRAHALAGIAGMFGFGEIGALAAELEDAGLAGAPMAEPARRLRERLAGLSA